jgi:hypothetical protein
MLSPSVEVLTFDIEGLAIYVFWNQPADYVFVNHVRWDMSLPRFAATQFGKRTFYSYVLANLRANGTVAMPILYRLA